MWDRELEREREEKLPVVSQFYFQELQKEHLGERLQPKVNQVPKNKNKIDDH